MVSMGWAGKHDPRVSGQARWCERAMIGDEPFAVLLPDVLVRAGPSCLAQMVQAYDDTGGNIIAVEQVAPEDVNKYGVIDPIDREGNRIRMRGMVEKPAVDKAPSNLAITGRYILQGTIFKYLEDQAAGAGGEIQLTDAMARLMQHQDFHAVEYEGMSYDCGDKLGYLRATLSFALHDPELGAAARKVAEAVLKAEGQANRA